MSMRQGKSGLSRRDFLEVSAATGALAATASLAHGVHTGGSDLLRVGLIGCGGRGTGAASQALKADKNVKLFAMADAFPDRIAGSLATLQKDEALADKLDVDPSRRYSKDLDAYKDVIACCDVVLLCTPPGFRPIHLKAAVEAGKHVFAEKPVAVDAPGVRSVLATCKEAEKKGLSLLSGLCLRYDNGFRESVKRIHEGAVGDICALHANDYRGGIWVKPRQPSWSDMVWQMRNWYYFTWLSGDFNVEQHVHFLDACAWLMGNEYPARAMGLGGRQVRTGPEFGHIYDHFSVVYEYANGVRLSSNCRQQVGCKNDMSVQVLGSKGRATLSERRRGHHITTKTSEWYFDGPEGDLYQQEHDEFFASIRSSKPFNNGEYMAKSTLLAIMGRMAAYTGQEITWDMALNSKEDLSPPQYSWDVPRAVPPVPCPGQTRFV
jgi:predicted dehydrogenase